MMHGDPGVATGGRLTVMASLLASALLLAGPAHAVVAGTRKTPVVKALLSAADTQRALRLAGESDGVRARFHAPYVSVIPGSVITEIQVLTEFRRTVIAAEEARRRGDWTVAQGARSLSGLSVDDVVRPWRAKVTIAASLQLDAMHTYVAVPNCEVLMGGMPVIGSLDRRVTPRSSMRYTSRGGTTTSLLGALIEADFDAASLGGTSRLVLVLCDGKEVARRTIDFDRLE